MVALATTALVGEVKLETQIVKFNSSNQLFDDWWFQTYYRHTKNHIGHIIWHVQSKKGKMLFTCHVQISYRFSLKKELNGLEKSRKNLAKLVIYTYSQLDL